MTPRYRTKRGVSFATAEERDVEDIAAIRNAAADALTREHGPGHWSTLASPEDVLRWLRSSRVLLARAGGEPAGVLRLKTKKPWAIDVAHFTPVRRPLYLVDLAVAPGRQGLGIGRALLGEAIRATEAWPGDAIRLDAYDAPAGAGAFYARCGWTERGHATWRGVPLVYYEYVLSRAGSGT